MKSATPLHSVEKKIHFIRRLEEVFSRRPKRRRTHLMRGRETTSDQSIEILEIREFLSLTTRPVFQRIVKSVHSEVIRGHWSSFNSNSHDFSRVINTLRIDVFSHTFSTPFANRAPILVFDDQVFDAFVFRYLQWPPMVLIEKLFSDLFFDLWFELFFDLLDFRFFQRVFWFQIRMFSSFA